MQRNVGFHSLGEHLGGGWRCWLGPLGPAGFLRWAVVLATPPYFFAQAVGESGEVVGADRDAWEIEAHRKLYDGHSFSSRIHIHQGEALDVLDSLPGEFDVFLLDCDKSAYVSTIEHILPRLRAGGLVLADNVLWGGRTTQEPAAEDVSTRGLRDFNRLVHAHPDLESQVLPVGDGLAVCRKRAG